MAQNNVLDVSDLSIDNAACIALINKHYGLAVKSLERQNGFESITFLVTTEDDAKFTFKVLSSPGKGSLAEHEIKKEIDLQRYLSENGINVPKPILTLSRKDFDYEEFVTKSNVRRQVPFRLQSFIIGRRYDFTDEKVVELYSLPICRQLGKTIGKMHKLLAKFPIADYPSHDEFLERIVLVEQPMANIFPTNPNLDERRRAYYHRYYHDMYLPTVKAKIDQLPKHFTHCDLHVGNFLIDKETSSRLNGIIDFGLARVTTRFVDPAMVVFNILLLSGPDGIERSKEFLGAYEEQYPLNDAEKAAFRTGVIGNYLRFYLFLCVNPTLAVGRLTLDGQLHGKCWNLLEKLFDAESPSAKLCSFQE